MFIVSLDLIAILWSIDNPCYIFDAFKIIKSRTRITQLVEHGLDTVFAISLYKDHQLPISMAIFQSISPSAVHGNRADEESLPFSNTKARSIVAIGKYMLKGRLLVTSISRGWFSNTQLQWHKHINDQWFISKNLKDSRKRLLKNRNGFKSTESYTLTENHFFSLGRCWNDQ